jgi:hypothetical protein
MLRRTLLLHPAPAAPPAGGGAPAGGGSPAPSPAPAPAPTPTPAPAPAGGGAPGGGAEPSAADKFDTAFQDLEDGDAGGGTPTPAPAPAPAPKGKPDPKGKAQPAPAPAPKPGEEFEEIDGIQVPKFKKDGEFRAWGLNGYKKAKQLESELTNLNTRITELQGLVPKNPKEAEELRSRLQTLETSVQEREREIQYLNYERSQEFKDKYQKPYHDAIRAANRDVKELLVTEPDPNQPPGENGQRPTREREATAADFEEIYQAPLGVATRLAKQKFGDAASLVIGHRAKIRELAEQSVNALNEWKGKAEEREKQQREQHSARETQIQTDWTELNRRMSEDPRAKEWWGEELEDKELNDATQKGFTFADQRFSDAYEKMPYREQLLLDAAIRHRVAGFYKRGVMLKRLKAENEQLKKDNAQLRESGELGGGGGGGGEGGKGAGESEGAMAEFDKKL